MISRGAQESEPVHRIHLHVADRQADVMLVPHLQRDTTVAGRKNIAAATALQHFADDRAH
jgi:hypothetical protein